MSDATDHGRTAGFPTVIYNPPGLSAINYRVGDFSSFREALLQNLPGEVELKGWRPTADGDLALQLLEWWAYIADIITFYNERIANNSYIGTAVLPIVAQTPAVPTSTPASALGSSAAPGLPDNATLIAGGLGFRTTPGIAANGQLAVLVNARTPITLPASFAIQSKPGPGQQPQVFEAVASTNTFLPTASGGAVPVDLSWPTYFTPNGVTIDPATPSPATQQGPLAKGAISGIKAGDMVVIAEIASPPANATSMAVTVQLVTTENDPRGRANTRLTLVTPFILPSSFTSGSSPDVTACQVLRGIQSAATYAFSKASAAGAAQTGPAVCGLVPSASPIGVHLASLVRDIAVGDLVVLEIVTMATPPPAGPATYVTAVVSTYQETVWYANADDPATAPQDPPDASTADPPTEIAIPIPHTFITLESAVETGTLAAMDPSGQTVTQTIARVWYGYRPVSTLLDEIPVSPIQSASTIARCNVQPAGVVSPTFATGTIVLVEGTDGLGAAATLTAPLTASGPIKLTSSATVPLALPLRLLFNVIGVTAGKTVTNEVLGNGDGTAASQSFTLAKLPLTYLPGTNPAVPVSTLQVRVDNVAWTEVANFNGQAANAKVFVTQQDKSQNTTVTFGDGVHGSRLTTGTANVTATYRYGSGPGDPSLGGPPPTTLVTILTPYPGLGSVCNPVPMTGGAAPRYSGPGATERTKCGTDAWARGVSRRLPGDRRANAVSHARPGADRVGPGAAAIGYHGLRRRRSGHGRRGPGGARAGH